MPPRTRAAAEATSARRNVLTDTDLLSLVFEQLDAPSLCRAATVCKVWQKTEVEKHWRALLASRWPHSDDLLEVVRKLDGYGQQDSKLGKVSKTMFRHYLRKGTISDFAFEVDMGYVFPEEENGEDPGGDGIAKDNALLSDEDPTSSDEGTPLQDTPPGERRLPVDPYKRSGSSDLTQWKA